MFKMVKKRRYSPRIRFDKPIFELRRESLEDKSKNMNLRQRGLWCICGITSITFDLKDLNETALAQNDKFLFRHTLICY